MKPQDILFILVAIILVIIKRGKYAWHAAMISFICAGVLFAVGNLYTSQRLSWYAAGFMAIAIGRNMVQRKK